MRHLFIALAAVSLLSCSKQKGMLDNEHNSFYINGVSAIEGQKAIEESLLKDGFTMLGEPVEADLTAVGQGKTIYVNYKSGALTDEQISKLTGGLFDNLPSTCPPSEISKTGGCRVFLEWYPTGDVKDALVCVGDFIPVIEEDKPEIHKRLSSMFPHSRVISSEGHKAYYNDNGVEVQYMDTYDIKFIKK